MRLIRKRKRSECMVEGCTNEAAKRMPVCDEHGGDADPQEILNRVMRAAQSAMRDQLGVNLVPMSDLMYPNRVVHGVLDILNSAPERGRRHDEERDKAQHERLEAISTRLDAVESRSDHMASELSDAELLRLFALELLILGSETGWSQCVHDDEHPNIWRLLDIADRLDMLDLGIAEGEAPEPGEEE